MSKEKVLAPEINLLKKDEFYLFYEMMMQSLKTDNVKEGINKSLMLLKTYLNSGNIVLYKQIENGSYIYKSSDSSIDNLIPKISCIVNKTSPLVEKNEIYNLDLNLSNEFKNVMLINIKSEDYNCILSIINVDKSKKLELHFWEMLKDTMQIIIKRAASYEKNTRAITTDLLTGLDNRNSYEIMLKKLSESEMNDNLVIGIFDLFRLKYINDNYGHTKGDIYIKETAKILDKYWPKQKTIIKDGIEQYIETGSFVYRVGGDEFILLTDVENLQIAELKAKLVSDEVSLINLGLEDDLMVGINYGIAVGNNIKETIKKADEILKTDKNKMYFDFGLERRK